ncbi:serine hydrolase domain-containing protein [Psychroserpens sp.]|uniref:serine hydrolase domain-containing protein n=1 Tax=Psychroserpens sp. TaxID=2020870 RepID=UPI001B187D91|nr:serine hydrolase domain-containing protein [Psychroserpens sp.]MBO6606841.1 beta-lactamase family protein [Psychroserpens sp.]MBO6632295.1 beta-lactamase family protein [Psychroserpens sp.]MBO6653544.1 beta-lactamase family protein [Psychroserpens sp.]MBO6680428.1 beta-lactamase family protein [Psychroserpens sp.]MBO6750613.1 beta-lactamase family protein [Psychroserpens sp.]
MTIRHYILFIFLLSFSSAIAQDVRDDFNKVKRISKKLVRKKKVPGIAISVVQNNSLVYSQGFGYANIEQQEIVDPKSTIFRIASVSKPIASVGLAKLYDSNNVSLDASIYNYIPQFPKKSFDFSLRQLGGHLAGIRSYKNGEFLNTKPLSINQGIDIFKNDALLFQPGTEFLYTSYGWNLIAHTIESITNLRFEDYIKTAILDPVGMIHTYADKNQKLINKAVFYTKVRSRKFKEATTVNNYYKLAGGGYLSTADDLSLFGKALLNEEIIDNNVLKEFTTSQEINGKRTYYGIGFESSFDHKGRPYFGHTGNGLGGYAIFRVYPEEKVVITILINCSNPDEDEAFNAIIDAFFDEKGII